MTDTALSAEADRFARRLRLLLDGTVAHDAPIAASTADGRALVGVIAPDGTFGSTVIPLTIGREHRLDLKFSYRCSLAARSPALTVETSQVTLSLSGTRSPVARFEYVRDRSWAASHVQLHAESSAIGHLRALAGRPAEMWRLHLPTGPGRFRLSLEDAIEFAIVEFGVDHHPGYETVLAEAREQWQHVQLEGAIRDLVRNDPTRGPIVLRRAIRDAQRTVAGA